MKKYIAALISVVLLMSLTAGCGSAESGEENAGKEDTVTDVSSGSTVDPASGTETAEELKESEFHIYSIGEDFKNRVQDFYPGYEMTGENSGLILDTKIVWHVYTDAQEYREILDEKLESQTNDTDPDKKIDMFVVDEAFLRDYVESDDSMDVVGEVGLTQEELSDQFLYTQQMATDADGKLKAVSWQATPGVFAYRRSIAREVLGTDDPEKVQEAVADWDAFADTAEAVKESGYYMLSGYEDAYRAYADNVTSTGRYRRGSSRKTDTRMERSNGAMNGERIIRVTERCSVSSTRAGGSTTRFSPRQKAKRMIRRAPQGTMRCAEVRSPAITEDSGSSRQKTAAILNLPVRS